MFLFIRMYEYTTVWLRETVEIVNGLQDFSTQQTNKQTLLPNIVHFFVENNNHRKW